MANNDNEKNNNSNSLYAWATGDLASIAIGLSVGAFLYKSGVIQMVTSRFFRGDTDSKTNSQAKAENWKN